MEMQLKLSSAMRENFGAVAGAIDNISSMVSDSITALAERMDRLETRVDQRMDRLENGISDMKGFYTEQKTAQQAEIITSDLNLQWVRILTRAN